MRPSINAIITALRAAFPSAAIEGESALIFVRRGEASIAIFVDDEGHRADDEGDTSARLNAVYDRKTKWAYDAAKAIRSHGVETYGHRENILSVDVDNHDITISVRRLLNAIEALEALDRRKREIRSRKAVAQ